MDTAAAIKLSYDLRRCNLTGGFVLRADVKDGRIVFSGGTQGEHSIAVDVSSKERILAHWEGYCENNQLPLPEVGEKVEFLGATGVYYKGVVKAIGPKRAKIEFRFRHGGLSTANVRHEDLRLAFKKSV